MFACRLGCLAVLTTFSGCAIVFGPVEKRAFPAAKPITEGQARDRAVAFLRKIGRGSSYRGKRIKELLGRAEYRDTYREPSWEFSPPRVNGRPVVADEINVAQFGGQITDYQGLKPQGKRRPVGKDRAIRIGLDTIRKAGFVFHPGQSSVIC